MFKLFQISYPSKGLTEIPAPSPNYSVFMGSGLKCAFFDKQASLIVFPIPFKGAVGKEIDFEEYLQYPVPESTQIVFQEEMVLVTYLSAETEEDETESRLCIISTQTGKMIAHFLEPDTLAIDKEDRVLLTIINNKILYVRRDTNEVVIHEFVRDSGQS